MIARMKTRPRLVVLILSLCLTGVLFLLINQQTTSPTYITSLRDSRIGKQLRDWQRQKESFGSAFDEVVVTEAKNPHWQHTIADVAALAETENAKEQAQLAADDAERTAREKEVLRLSHAGAIAKSAALAAETGNYERYDAQHEQGAPLPDKVVVMGRLHSDDVRWVAQELSDWQHAIYMVDPDNATDPIDPNTLMTPINKGREAMPYLTYIIEQYNSLPSVIAFIHPHRDGYPIAWHTDAPQHSNVYALQHLQLDYIKKEGYANLRCNQEPGCPAEVKPFTPKSTKEPEAHMAMAWPQLFPERAEDIPKVIGAACCAQFAVSAEQVRKRPLEDYIRIRNWVIGTEMSDFVSGRVLEYSWHIIFGKEDVHCPSSRDCYCNVYGRRCRRTGAVSLPQAKPAVVAPVKPNAPLADFVDRLGSLNRGGAAAVKNTFNAAQKGRVT